MEMKKLIAKYGLQSEVDYYEMIEESFADSQLRQARAQFEVMDKGHQKEFVKSLITHTDRYEFFFNLL